MSSDLFPLEYLQLNNYLSLTAVIYDYLLTFSKEVHYVWHRPWTSVSTMFVVTRYLGLTWAIATSLIGTSVVPVTVKFDRCIANYVIFQWIGEIFVATADLVMILRVYAMWNRSKWILYILLFLCVPQVIVCIVFTGLYNTPNASNQVLVAQIFNFSFCDAVYSNPSLIRSTYIASGALRLILSIALLIFAVAQTIKQSIDMYKATQQWQPNKYMQQLATDGILYFLVYAFWNVSAMASQAITSTETQISMFILFVLAAMLPIPIMPRFIISVRELYDRDLRARWDCIDSGFGVLSQHAASTNPVMSAIAFGDANPGQEDIHLVEDDAGASGGIGLDSGAVDNGTCQELEGERENLEDTRLEDHLCRV